MGADPKSVRSRWKQYNVGANKNYCLECTRIDFEFSVFESLKMAPRVCLVN